MKHAEYVAQGYEPMYEVTEPGMNPDGSWHVSEMEQGRKPIEHNFDTVMDAQAFADKLQAEIDEREVDVDWDNPEQEYKAQAMNELAGRNQA